MLTDHKSKRSSWRAPLRALIAGMLVVGITFLGPMAGPTRAADQPRVNIPIAQVPPSTVSSGDFALPEAQPTPASRWSIASPGTEQPNFHAELLNPSETTHPLDLSLPRNASPSYEPSPFPPAAPVTSWGGPIRKNWLAVGIAGAATAVIFGALIGSCGNSAARCDVREALMGVGAGTAALGFVMMFHH